jgi:hypothetical protein
MFKRLASIGAIFVLCGAVDARPYTLEIDQVAPYRFTAIAHASGGGTAAINPSEVRYIVEGSAGNLVSAGSPEPGETVYAIVPPTVQDMYAISASTATSNASPPTYFYVVSSRADDTDLKTLLRTFVGRMVYGKASLRCVAKPNVHLALEAGDIWHAGLRIVSIARAYGNEARFSGAGMPAEAMEGERGSSYTTVSPLLVTVAVPATTTFGTIAFSGSGPHNPRKDCRAFTTTFSGAWDFNRRFALASPQKRHPGWSAATWHAIRTHAVKNGMTHEMIAVMFGYPPQYGTVARLDREATWVYDLPAPFDYTVHFTGDVVSGYDPPGDIP